MPSRSSPKRTFLTRLKLAGFRNYEALSLELDERSVVLTGPNGAGKTNLLEAVSFLSPGRGLRRAALEDVARRPGDGTWAVAATLVNAAGGVELGTGVARDAGGPERRRTIRVNHAPARASEALLEHLRVVWLTPAMDGLFTGPASDRRRFLDRAVLAIDRRHGTRVASFERAMRGRNRLLADTSPDPAWLSAIEIEMAELGVAIAAARREWAGLAAGLIAENGAGAAFPGAGIRLEGVLEEDLAGRSAAEVEDRYRATLTADRARDAAAGRTLSGPHLADLRVRHEPKGADAETCSTGEQKALLISIVLAEARLRSAEGERLPILLLDEVAAHLDPGRRADLFEQLCALGAQAWLTGTDPSLFAPLGARAQFFTVRDSTLHRHDQSSTA